MIHIDVAFSTLMTFSILNLHFLLWCKAFSTLMTFPFSGVAFSSPWSHFLSRCYIFYLDDIFYLDLVFSTLIAFSIMLLYFLPWRHFLPCCCIFYLDYIFYLDFASSSLMYNILYLDDISYFSVAFFMHWWHFLHLQ